MLNPSKKIFEKIKIFLHNDFNLIGIKISIENRLSLAIKLINCANNQQGLRKYLLMVQKRESKENLIFLGKESLQYKELFNRIASGA